MVDVDRDVCSTSKPCAWVICPVVSTAKGDGLWVIEVVHAAEERAQSVLLWLHQLLATKDFLKQQVCFVLAWVNALSAE